MNKTQVSLLAKIVQQAEANGGKVKYVECSPGTEYDVKVGIEGMKGDISARIQPDGRIFDAMKRETTSSDIGRAVRLGLTA